MLPAGGQDPQPGALLLPRGSHSPSTRLRSQAWNRDVTSTVQPQYSPLRLGEPLHQGAAELPGGSKPPRHSGWLPDMPGLRELGDGSRACTQTARLSLRPPVHLAEERGTWRKSKGGGGGSLRPFPRIFLVDHQPLWRESTTVFSRALGTPPCILTCRRI